MAASFVLIAFTCILSLSVSGNATTSNEFESSSYSDFSWSNCNKIPVPIKVKELSIIPSKLTLGKGFQLNTTVVLDEGIGKSGTAIEVELSLKMKIDGEYSELCDLAPAAFCYFPNFCNILDTMGNRCPPKLKERLHNCTCPFLECTVKPANSGLLFWQNYTQYNTYSSCTKLEDMQKTSIEVFCIAARLPEDLSISCFISNEYK